MTFYFNGQKSINRRKAAVYDLGQSKLVKFFYVLLIVIGFLGLAVPVLYYLPLISLSFFNLITLGLSFILFSISLGLVSFSIFYRSVVVNHAPRTSLTKVQQLISQGKTVNLANFVSLPALSAIEQAYSDGKTTAKIKSSDFLRALLENNRIGFITMRMGIPPKDFLANLDKFYQENQADDTEHEIASMVGGALPIAIAEGHQTIEVGDIFVLLSQLDTFFHKLAFNLDIKLEDIANIVSWETTVQQRQREMKFNPDKLKLKGGIGKEWASGYTRALSRFAYDLTPAVINFPHKYLTHQSELDRMEKILAKSSHHNVLLVGEPGVGKETLVLFLTKKIKEGHSGKTLGRRKIMKLDIDYLLAGAKTSGEIIERLTAALQDAVQAGNIMLYIDNINALFTSGQEGVGAVDASQVLIPYLENPQLYIIATTSQAGWHQSIEPRKIAAEKFEKIEVAEPAPEQVIKVLEEHVPLAEHKAKALVSYKALQAIVELADKYMYDKASPEKAINLLDGIATQAPAGLIISDKDVAAFLEQKLGIPVGEAAGQEKDKLLHLEEILHRRVIGQNEAVTAVANALRRARTGVKKGQKPIGSFLFLGPTGVGKTETCKALAESYFGSEDRIIRFDMSEYQDIASIHRFIGAPPGTAGAKAGGELTNAVKDDPFSLILFDELEKAHPNILNLFLQLLDEGWLTDSSGRKVRFSNSIIIATSNAGAEFIRKSLKQNLDAENLKQRLLDHLQSEGLFRPEFINRFTEVVSFQPLSPTDVKTITELLVNKFVVQIMDEKGIDIEITPAAIEKIAELGYDPLLGARPIKRTIQQKVENWLAKKMLSGEVERGSKLVIDQSDIEN
ncbi:MAG: ATP-dependent Clp protease ATP-binding subunit [Parcubacteria group bacterium]|nr:ATP-dependent Clp protease ATP-binding subunit [Parcubacteria group bacterium]